MVTRAALLLTAFLGAFAAAMLLAAPVQAAAFTVDSTVDAVDAAPGDGICADSTGDCTLRAAIQETNALPGADEIELPAGTYQLAIPGTGEDAAATGDLDITDELALLGAGAEETIVDAATLDSVFHVMSTPIEVLIANLTITGGASGASVGGAIVNQASLEIVNARLTGNEGSVAGGIYAIFSSTRVLDSELTENQGGTAGAIYNTGTLRVERSVVAGNEGFVGGIVSNGETGRGCGDAPVTLVNSTISGNAALPLLGVQLMGGVAVGLPPIIRGCCTGGPLFLINTTVTGNDGGGIRACDPVTLRSSIVANQMSGADCVGPLLLLYLSNGSNVDSDGTCGLTDSSDLPATDPLLGPLQDNGGPTWTHALLPGSPAIDAIPLADCTWDDDGDPGTPEVPVAWDQRGVPRPQNADCDIGAYEVTACADGINNDTDAFTDLDDPGCRDATSVREDPQCQDGINNDPGQDPDPGLIDFDGGLSALGYVVSDPDPQCVGTPWKNKESAGGPCGLGFELALILPGLMWLRRRRRGLH